MLIGELAKKANVSVDTIRYYEREGLIEPVSLRESGYREFDSAAVERLHFITKAKQLGFSLKEIRDLLSLKDDPDTTCKQVKALAERKLTEITDKINALQTMQKELEPLVSLCKGNGEGLKSCAIVSTLDGKEK